MYAQLEEDHGLAKRAMLIYDRATQVVADGEKFEVRVFYPVTCKTTVLMHHI
jgi:pre-mRNA-splicing factor SYF1